MTKVLLIGLDRYILRACVKGAIDVVVVCSHAVLDKGAVEIGAAVEVIAVDDQSNVEQVLAALERTGNRRFDGVLTTDEWSLAMTATLAQLYGCPTPGWNSAVRLRDKSLQKATIREAGISVADTYVIDDIQSFDSRLIQLWPAVLKPIAGAATRNTAVIHDDTELEHFRSHLSGTGRTYLAEEYVDGVEEWCADGIVFEGEVVFYALGGYAETCLTMLEQQHPFVMTRLDPRDNDEKYKSADPIVKGAIAALGYTDGVFHMELFYDPRSQSVTFSECAGRRGGVLVHEEVEYKFGIDLGAASMACALGIHPKPDVILNDHAIGTSFLLGPAGTLISAPSEAEILEQPGVEFVRVDTPLGSSLTSSLTNTNERMAQILVSGNSHEAVLVRADELRRWYSERLKVLPPNLSGRELRNWQRENWPLIGIRDSLFSRNSGA